MNKIDQKLEDILQKAQEHIDSMTAEFFVVNMTAQNVGQFSMTPEKAQEFHDMISQWLQTTGLDVTVINTSINTMIERLRKKV